MREHGCDRGNAVIKKKRRRNSAGIKTHSIKKQKTKKQQTNKSNKKQHHKNTTKHNTIGGRRQDTEYMCKKDPGQGRGAQDERPGTLHADPTRAPRRLPVRHDDHQPAARFRDPGTARSSSDPWWSRIPDYGEVGDRGRSMVVYIRSTDDHRWSRRRTPHASHHG